MLSTATFLSSGVALTLSIWLSGRLLDRRNFANFGFQLNPDWWTDFGFGLALGAGLMGMIFLVELALGWISISGIFTTLNPETPFLIALLYPLIIFLAVGFYEELLSRGYRLKNLAEGLSGKYLKPRSAILLATMITAINFGIMHASNPNANLASTLNISLAGLFLSTAYVLTGQLAIPIALHISWNFFQGNVFGFPVSGMSFRSATVIQVEQGGPDLWTGGAFGPEAGLLSTLIMILGILITLFWVRKRYGRIAIFLPLSDPPATVQQDQKNNNHLPGENNL
ncbi:MAG: CPBP family intramembrane metalloprotease [Anaerolineales bacterium]|nr:CPBP family intramembrane metalloprotease [Anaerolineales bacterium]